LNHRVGKNRDSAGLLIGVGIPEVDFAGPVLHAGNHAVDGAAAPGQTLAVVLESQALNRAAAAGHASHKASCGYLPQPDETVGSAGRQDAAARSKRDGVHRSHMRREDGPTLPCRRVPEANRAVRAAAGRPPAVRRDRQRHHARVMTTQRLPVAVQLPPEVMPFEAAQIGLARQRPLGLEQAQHRRRVALFEGLHRQRHLGRVQIAPPLLADAFAPLQGALFGPPRGGDFQAGPGRTHGEGHQEQQQRRRQRRDARFPPAPAPQPFDAPHRPGLNRLAAQVAADVGRKVRR